MHDYLEKGWFAYRSKLGSIVAAMQVPGAYDVFLKLFNKVQFDTVIEIGTAQGGTTLIVRDALNESGNEQCKLITYDPQTDSRFYESYNQANQFTKLEENIFTTGYTGLKEDSSIKKYLSKTGTNLILCDGGYKKREFNILSPLLKSGDFIMAHDYAKDSEYFNNKIKGKIWNWLEIKFSDVQKSFDDFNLEQFMEKDFSEVAWLCCRKS